MRDSLPALLNHLPWGNNWLGQVVSFYIGTRFFTGRLLLWISHFHHRESVGFYSFRAQKWVAGADSSPSILPDPHTWPESPGSVQPTGPSVKLVGIRCRLLVRLWAPTPGSSSNTERGECAFCGHYLNGMVGPLEFLLRTLSNQNIVGFVMNYRTTRRSSGFLLNGVHLTSPLLMAQFLKI